MHKLSFYTLTQQVFNPEHANAGFDSGNTNAIKQQLMQKHLMQGLMLTLLMQLIFDVSNDLTSGGVISGALTVTQNVTDSR